MGDTRTRDDRIDLTLYKYYILRMHSHDFSLMVIVLANSRLYIYINANKLVK